MSCWRAGRMKVVAIRRGADYSCWHKWWCRTSLYSTHNSRDGSLCSRDDDRFHILLYVLIINFIHVIPWMTGPLRSSSLATLPLHQPFPNLRMPRPNLKTENLLRPIKTSNPNSDQHETNRTSNKIQNTSRCWHDCTGKKETCWTNLNYCSW